MGTFGDQAFFIHTIIPVNNRLLKFTEAFISKVTAITIPFIFVPHGLAEPGFLHFFDYLSTVSGGGYFGRGK